MADDDVADALRERLARYMSDGDPGVILAPEAVREAAALRASIGWPAFGRPLSGAAIRRELDAVVVAGMFHYVRYQELAIDDRVDALLAAMELFTAVYPFASAAVPEPMRVMCADCRAEKEGPVAQTAHWFREHTCPGRAAPFSP